MESIKWYLVFVFVIFRMYYSRAQDPYYYNLSNETTLPDTEIYSLLVAPDNSVWIAANRGLYNFDGKDYHYFTHKEKKGLSVFGLKYDFKGRLWCNTISGQFFYVENGELNLFIDLREELKGTLSEFIFYQGDLFVFSSTKIIKVEKNKQIEVLFETDSRIGSPCIFNDSIFFTTGNKVCFFKNGKTNYLNDVGKEDFSLVFTTRCFSYGDKLYLIYNDFRNNLNFFYEYREGTFYKTNVFDKIKNLRIVNIDKHDKSLYFSTSKGVHIYKGKDGKLSLFSSFFETVFMTAVKRDKSGLYWFSSVNEGIFVVPNLDFKYVKLLDKEDYITCIENADQNIVFIGTFRGKLIKYNIPKKQSEIIRTPPNNSKITCLEYVPDLNRLFVSSENNFFSYDLATSKLNKSKLGLINAKSLSYSSNRRALLYSTFDRASIVEINEKDIEIKNNLGKKRAYSIAENKTNNEIIVSFTDETKVYPFKGEPYSLMYNNSILLSNHVVSTKNGITWVCSYNNGVLGYKKQGLVKEINLNQGLFSTLIYKIVADENLWILTDKGIQLYDIGKENMINYISSSTDPEKRFVDFTEQNEKIIIATNNSLLLLPKENVFLKYQPDSISIKKTLVNNKPVNFLVRNELEHYENQLFIEAQCNGYFPKGTLEYEYKLNNSKDSKWKVFRDNGIYFEGLGPNKYSLNIRVKNVVTNQYVYAQPLDFTILNPFWKRGWFIICCFVFVFVLGYLFYRYQIKLKEKENILALKQATYEKELVSLQLDNLKSQMNPHFIFNALNSIQEYIILNERDLASNYLAKFALLIRAYLNHSTQGLITIEDEVECLNNYLELEKLRFEDKLVFEINLNNVNEEIKIPTMLIQPYVENALKHGLLHKKDNRCLSIHFFHNRENNELICIVEDNGVGREKAKKMNTNKHKSFATKANLNRLELLNKERDKNIGVLIEDLYQGEIAIGTKVTLRIPIL